MSKMTTKELIKDYVDDHYAHFECYPIDVAISVDDNPENDTIYTWEQYWEILDNE